MAPIDFIAEAEKFKVVEDDKGPVIVDVVEKEDYDGVYYSVDVSGFVILPVDVGGSVGVSTFDQRLEIEAYVAIRAIRFLTEDNTLHIPYGTRVRVALNGSRTFYAEYEHEEVLDRGSKYGLLDKSRHFYLTWRPAGRSGTTSLSCGAGVSTHHAWSDEVHNPERGASVRCKFQRKL